jgi:peptidoglycan/LPS O-acetylase OafA/YrhL
VKRDAWPFSDAVTGCHVTVDENLSSLLDFFRWLSAFVVLLAHSRAIFFVPWGEVEAPGVVPLVLYTVSGWGDYGVLVFFAISGYLIGGGSLEKLRAGRFDFVNYLIDRFSRIYIVLLPALLLIWALDAGGMHWLNASGIYTKGYPIGALPHDTRDVTGVAAFTSNLLMLQNVVTPPFGTAQPLWSLNWEWWSYMVSPFLIGALLRLGGIAAMVTAALVGAAMVAADLGYMLLWHLGILLAMLKVSSRAMLIAGASLCIALPLCTRSGLLPASLPVQAMFLLGFVMLVAQLRYCQFPRWWSLLPNKWLASFSYSLYVLHTTLLVFVMACLQSFAAFPRQLQPTTGNYVLYAGFCLSAGALSYLFASLTEYNTRSFRRWLLQRIRRLPRRGME